MRALVDTNVLIRHLTWDPPNRGLDASRFLRSGHDLLLTDLVVAEVVYVLESFYGQPRERIANAVRTLIALPGVVVADAKLLLRALEVYEDLRLDFAEAYLVSASERWSMGTVVSFDRSLDRATTVERVEPE